ncbi:stress response protein nst1-like [Camellia sinensis]|uniref:stress response protein nst1-like n=1 Tax=Camellia sinensis TaxID=4442 RepID=UPI00103609EA|nr:stress response protein nst1-like [Camellia sinensis]
MALVFPSFKALRQIGLEASDSEQDLKPVVEAVAESTKVFAAEVEEVDEALKSAFAAAGLNQPNSPSTSGRAEFFFGYIFTNLGDLPSTFSEGMAGENLTHMARKRNAKRMAVRKKAEAAHSEPAPVESLQPVTGEETARVVVAEMEGAEQQVTEERLVSKEQGEKCSTEREAGSKDSLADKRPRLEESDVVVPFVVQPKIKDMPISSDTSAMKDPAVALSLAASVSLPADKMVRRIAELGRRQRNVIERIGRLKFEAEGERSRVEFEAMRAAMESARAQAEKERARTVDRLRSKAKDRVNTSEESLKLAQEAFSKAEAELEKLKAAKEKAVSEASTTLEAGKNAALKEYVDEGLYTAYEIDMRLRAAHREIEKRDERIRSLEARAEAAERELKEVKAIEAQPVG